MERVQPSELSVSPATPIEVSVVIPVYRQAREAERAVRSVLAQTLPPREVLVVDDGSPDGVPDAGDPRVRVLRQPHAGVSVARNHGAERAQCEWVAFLDADDEWAPGFLEATAAVAARRADVVAVFSNVTFVERGRPLLRHEPRRTEALADYFRVPLANDGYGMCSSSVLVRRRAFLQCGGFPAGVRQGEDEDTWARLAWTGEIGYVPRCLVCYHADAAVRATRRLPGDVRPVPPFLETYREWSEQGRIPPPLRASSRALASFVLSSYLYELVHAGRAAAARALQQRYRYGPRPWRPYLKARLAMVLPGRLLGAGRRLKRRFRL
jgi:glycosyltransferase involved in cell wall biosynthesis